MVRQPSVRRVSAAERGIVIAEYDPEWPRGGAECGAAVLAAGNGVVLRVDHIGSTSIAGMAAKNVIDLQAIVEDLDAAAAALEAPLVALGYERLPYEHDHVPAGSDDDPERWVKRLFSRRNATGPSVNLHVRLVGSPNARLALLFRDWFRAHREVVPAYAAFKRTLAAEMNDVGAYSDVKDPVVDLIIAIAEPWATASGWAP
jgi:GrpB-like predicted nucleotidyltransferase (UPF0157 family)